MERRKFTREFKLEAVRLIKDRGVSYVQASQDLGVHTSQLRDWVKKLADDPQHAFPGYSQNDLDAVAFQLNTRPRKTLGFITPAVKLAQTVALID